jgi:hypothetical protein
MRDTSPPQSPLLHATCMKTKTSPHARTLSQRGIAPGLGGIVGVDRAAVADGVEQLVAGDGGVTVGGPLDGEEAPVVGVGVGVGVEVG